MMDKRIQLPQESETELRGIGEGPWYCRYGYSRSYESRQAGDSGQDYVAFEMNGRTVSFTVCDGISMSYFGELAAKFLGDALLGWLKNVNKACPEMDALQMELKCFLQKSAAMAARQFDGHQIPSHIKGMLREVLASKKQRGSGTVYACGRIDLPQSAFPEGRLLLAWQGDIRVRLWDGQDERKDILGDRFQTRNQWNSTAGPVGEGPHLYCGSLTDWSPAGSVLMYSDGLKALDQIGGLTEQIIRDNMQHEANNPSSDDMSLFHVRWTIPD